MSHVKSPKYIYCIVLFEAIKVHTSIATPDVTAGLSDGLISYSRTVTSEKLTCFLDFVCEFDERLTIWMVLVLVDTCTLLSNLTPESLTNHPPLRGFATPSSNIPDLRAVCGVISAFHTQQHWWPQKEMYQQALYLIGS